MFNFKRIFSVVWVAFIFLLFYFTGEFSFLFATVIPFTQGFDTAGTPGKRAKTGDFQERSKVAEEEVKFGQPVSLGTEGDQVKVTASGSDVFAGIAVYNIYAKGFDSGKYNQYDPVVVAYEGIYWVHTEEAVNQKSTVRVRIVNHASDVTKLKGNFCKTAETGKTAVLKGAFWDGARSDAGAVELRLTGSFELVAD